MTNLFGALKAKGQVGLVTQAIGFTDPNQDTWAETLDVLGKRAAAALKSRRTTKPETLRRCHAVAAQAQVQWQRTGR